jgi:hypothetical protein
MLCPGFSIAAIERTMFIKDSSPAGGIQPRMHPTHLLLKTTVVIGSLLSVLLLIETIRTYRYVVRDLVREEAQRESERYVRSIVRSARLMHIEQPSSLEPLLRDIVGEYPHQIAWIRIIARDGRTISFTGRANESRAYSADELRTLLKRRRTSEWKASSGAVILALNPLRLQPAGDPSPISSGAPAFIEVAILPKGISVNFGPLRQDLIIGISAALALLGAVILIRLRFGEYIRAKQIEKELVVARQVQTALFPPENSAEVDTEFAARCVPAWEVGGDLYDVFATEDGETAFVLGDVSGKGLPAALLMGLVQGAVRASCGDAASKCTNTAEHLNRLLCAKTARERFVTMFWCTFNTETGILRYVNAGHCPPLLFRNTGEVLRLEVGGPVLGVLKGARYEHGAVTIQPGDLLVVYSDGIIEAADAQEQEFGEERLMSLIQRNRDQTPVEICNNILQNVGAFLAGQAAQDDQTLVIARLQPVQVGLFRPAEVARQIAVT